MRAKTGIFVAPSHFEYYVDRGKTMMLGIHVPSKTITVTQEEALKLKYIVFDRGELFVRNRIDSEDKIYHEKAKRTLEELKQFVSASYEEAEKDAIKGDWLQKTIDRYHHPEKYVNPQMQVKKYSFFELMEDFREHAKKKVNGRREGDKSDLWKRNFNVLIRALRRYELFVRLTDKQRTDYKMDIERLNADGLSEIEDFLRNEFALQEQYPQIFKMIPSSTIGNRKAQPRGNNTICALFNKLKAFYSWCMEKGITTNNPFRGYEGVVSEKYGTPYYITLEERNVIADYDLSAHHALEVQRDIFIFQCCIGCRVSDLMKLTSQNVINGAVEYIPHKTKGERQNVVRVPLNERAARLIQKYEGVDSRGRLFPFIASQNYNSAIKEIFALCEVVRPVTIINSITGKEEQVPINQVASSHMARRCFVGNLYKKVKDPNLIASMSGHAEGSKAFNRYREIDDELKREVVSLID